MRDLPSLVPSIRTGLACPLPGLAPTDDHLGCLQRGVAKTRTNFPKFGAVKWNTDEDNALSRAIAGAPKCSASVEIGDVQEEGAVACHGEWRGVVATAHASDTVRSGAGVEPKIPSSDLINTIDMGSICDPLPRSMAFLR